MMVPCANDPSYGDRREEPRHHSPARRKSPHTHPTFPHTPATHLPAGCGAAMLRRPAAVQPALRQQARCWLQLLAWQLGRGALPGGGGWLRFGRRCGGCCWARRRGRRHGQGGLGGGALLLRGRLWVPARNHYRQRLTVVSGSAKQGGDVAETLCACAFSPYRPLLLRQGLPNHPDQVAELFHTARRRTPARTQRVERRGYRPKPQAGSNQHQRIDPRRGGNANPAAQRPSAPGAQQAGW